MDGVVPRRGRHGVVVLGEDRGRLLQVCIAKKQCTRHWDKASERVAERAADAANRQAAAQRAARDQARQEQERTFWEQQLRPALLSAIAKKAKQRKTRIRDFEKLIVFLNQLPVSKVLQLLRG